MAVRIIIIIALTVISTVISGGCSPKYGFGTLQKRLSLPDKKKFHIRDLTISPNLKYVSYFAIEEVDEDKLDTLEFDPYEMAVLDIVNQKSKIIFDDKNNPGLWIDKMAWTRKNNDLFIQAVTEKKGKRTNFVYLYNAKTDKLRLLSSSYMKKQKNKYEFLVDDRYHVFIYNETKFFLANSGYGAPGQRNFLLDVTTGRKQMIPFNTTKETSGFINKVIFSDDGSLIVFEAKPRYDEYDSKGLWLYYTKEKRLVSLPKTRAKKKTVYPLALSNNKRWLLYYFAPSHSSFDKPARKKRSVYLYDLEKTKPIKSKLKLESFNVSNIQWMPDNKHFQALIGDSIYEYNFNDII